MPQYTHDELREAMLFVQALTQLRCTHAFLSEDTLALLCDQAVRLFNQGDYYAAFCTVADYHRCTLAAGNEQRLDPPNQFPLFLLKASEQQGFRILN